MAEHESQLGFPNPDRYVPLTDKDAILKKAQEIAEKKDEEITDDDCFQLTSDVTTQLEGTPVRGVSHQKQEYEYTQYSRLPKGAQYPVTIKLWEKGMGENTEGELIPLGENDQRIDVLLLQLPENTKMTRPVEETFTFTRTFGEVAGRTDSPGSISFFSAPLIPDQRRNIITALTDILDDTPSIFEDTGEFVGPL